MTTMQRSKPIPVLVDQALCGLGERLVLARKARELTQADLARLADVGLSTVAALEGGHAGVALGNALKVFKALGLLAQIDELLAPARDPALVAYATRRLGG